MRASRESFFARRAAFSWSFSLWDTGACWLEAGEVGGARRLGRGAVGDLGFQSVRGGIFFVYQREKFGLDL